MNKFYLGEFEYFATGEGYTAVAAFFVGPEDKDEARLTFYKKFLSETFSPDGYNYFKIGIDLIELGDWDKRYPRKINKSVLLKRLVSDEAFCAFKDVFQRKGIGDEGLVVSFRYNLS